MEAARGDAGLTLAERVSDGWNAFLGRIRHPEAATVTEPRTDGFDHLRGKHCLVVSFRRSGEPVPTPVWFGRAGRPHLLSQRGAGRQGEANSARTHACWWRRATRAASRSGSAAEGRARILAANEEGAAEAAIQSNFGVGRRMYEGVAMSAGPAGVYVEVEPS